MKTKRLDKQFITIDPGVGLPLKHDRRRTYFERATLCECNIGGTVEALCDSMKDYSADKG